jgi:hypothetical protein
MQFMPTHFRHNPKSQFSTVIYWFFTDVTVHLATREFSLTAFFYMAKFETIL